MRRQLQQNLRFLTLAYCIILCDSGHKYDVALVYRDKKHRHKYVGTIVKTSLFLKHIHTLVYFVSNAYGRLQYFLSAKKTTSLTVCPFS